MRNDVTSILEAIEKSASQFPDRLAVGDKKKHVNYKEFWDMIRRAATYLRAEGVEPGSIVVLRSAQKVEYLVGFLATQLAGAVACPLEKAIKDERILEIMNFMDSSIYLAERPVSSAAVKNISLKKLYKMAEAKESPMDSFPLPSPGHLAEILFTTGTTGKSKGIEITFENDIALAQNVAEGVQMAFDEVELITAPINHSLAIRRFYGIMYNQSSAILTDGFVFVEDFFRLLDQYKVTAIAFVPAILDTLLKFAKERFASYDAQFHYIQTGAAPLPEADKELLASMFPHVRLYNIYGATEAGCTTILEFNKYPDKKNCIGRPTVNSAALFVDENKNEIEASPEHPGYLAFRGKMNMRGYYKEPEMTAKVLQNGNIYTSDMGYPGEDGFIYLLGRKGDVINVGGLKIAPTKIEEVVKKHGKILDCACVPVPDEITGEALKLYVVMKEGCRFDQKELSQFLQEKLEAFKIPKIYQVIDEIPRTFNGKIIRKQLREGQTKDESLVSVEKLPQKNTQEV